MNAKKKPKRELFACPHCGADVMVGAKVCRECGSDAGTGWQDDDAIDYASVDLPDGYRGEPVGDELPPARLPRWVVFTALLLATLLLAAVTGVFAWW